MRDAASIPVRPDKIMAWNADPRAACRERDISGFLLRFQSIGCADTDDRRANQCCNEGFHDAVSRLKDQVIVGAARDAAKSSDGVVFIESMNGAGI